MQTRPVVGLNSSDVKNAQFNSNIQALALVPGVADAVPSSLHRPELEVDIQQLNRAFNQFNEVSQHLAESYHLLEDRVSELTTELDDVTEQRITELAEKEQLAARLESLLAVLPGGVVVLDERGVVTQTNPAAQQLLGDSLEGKLWRQVIEQCFAPQQDDGHEVSTKNGRRYSIATSSVEEGGQLILLTDQTQTRRLQAELSRHERLSAMGRMVSALAHQIRTPLSTAMLYAGHLAEGGLSAPKVEQFSTKLLSRLNHLEQQVQDMLLFAKGELPLNDRISVQNLAEGLREAMEIPLQGCEARCDFAIDDSKLTLRCNREALIGALLNLANNAMQAVNRGAELTVKFEVNESQLFISVCDRGPGISTEELQKVQEVFYTTKSHGTGLGLAVVQSVARAHGGEFSLDSSPGNGVCALVCLPLTE